VLIAEMVVTVEELLPASPEAVFALLTDVERMGGLGPENVRSRWVDDRRGVGAVFRGYNSRGDLAWDVPCRVVEHVPPTRFAWTTGNPEHPSATWSYELAPVEGGTLVTQTFRHGDGFTYLRAAAERRPEKEEEYVADRAEELERNMLATLRAAAKLLAGEPA
jgi:uncharacterized protein YndB with AHSA1/START domain